MYPYTFSVVKLPFSGEPVPMGPWRNGQPDGGEAQNCVVYGNYGDAKWLDYFCSGRLTSICQKTS